MTTQPQFPNSGTHPPPRSRRFPRNHRHLPVGGEPARSPRRACPEPVEGAVSNHPWDAATKPILTPPSRRPRRTCPEPVEGGPSSNQHPRPTAVPRQSAPPNPPIPPGPNRPLTRPELAKIRRPPPSRVFWKKLLRAQSTPVSVSPFSNQEPSPFHHPGVLSRNPAATSQPGLPCRPVSPITQAHRSLPAQPPDAKC